MGFLQCVRATFIRKTGSDAAPQVDSFLVSTTLSSRIPKPGEVLTEAGLELLQSFMDRLQLTEVRLGDITNPQNCPSVPAEWIVKGFDGAGNPIYHSPSEGISLRKSQAISKKPGFGPTITNHHDL